MKNIRIILIGLFLLSSFGYSIQNKDIVGEWRVSEDNEQWSDYPGIQLRSKGFVTLLVRGDTIYRGNYNIDNDNLLISLGEHKENLKIISHTKDTLILSGFSSHLIFYLNYKLNDTVTYIRYDS